MHKLLEPDTGSSWLARVMHTMVDAAVTFFTPEFQARIKTHSGKIYYYSDWFISSQSYGLLFLLLDYLFVLHEMIFLSVHLLNLLSVFLPQVPTMSGCMA